MSPIGPKHWPQYVRYSVELVASDTTVHHPDGSDRSGIADPRCGYRAGCSSRSAVDLGNQLENVAGCYMVIDRKQETFFVLEQTASERRRIQ